MKKAVALLLILSLAFVFCGCSDNSQNTSANVSIVDKYMETADKYIAGGDLETAIKVLNEGVEKTGNQALKEKFDTVTKQLEEQKKAEEEKQKAEAEKKKAEEEKINKLLGTYSMKTTDYDITLYKSGDKLKAYVVYGRMSGYFELIDNGNGSYTFVNDGFDVVMVKNQKYKMNLIRDLLYGYFCNSNPSSMKITPLTDGSEFTLTYVYDNGNTFSENFYRDAARSNPDFEEKYY